MNFVNVNLESEQSLCNVKVGIDKIISIIKNLDKEIQTFHKENAEVFKQLGFGSISAEEMLKMIGSLEESEKDFQDICDRLSLLVGLIKMNVEVQNLMDGRSLS